MPPPPISTATAVAINRRCTVITVGGPSDDYATAAPAAGAGWGARAGRGSGAGSGVAWALTITDLDPLRFGLLFERFLNPERVEMPDIDIDFCVRGRGEVINHVAGLYGRDSVCQIITFGTLASKAAITCGSGTLCRTRCTTCAAGTPSAREPRAVPPCRVAPRTSDRPRCGRRSR